MAILYSWTYYVEMFIVDTLVMKDWKTFILDLTEKEECNCHQCQLTKLLGVQSHKIVYLQYK